MGDKAQSQPELVWDRISYLLRLPSNLKPLSPEYNSAVQQWVAENLGIPVDHGLFRLALLSPRGLLRTIESAFVLEDSQRASSYAGKNPETYADISPRHPAYESGKPWLPLHPDLGGAVGGGSEHAEVGSEPISRQERLQAFILTHPGTTLADIKYSASVYTPELQDWRKDRLKQESVMSRRIEDVLSGKTQLKKNPRKPRPN